MAQAVIVFGADELNLLLLCVWPPPGLVTPEDALDIRHVPRVDLPMLIAVQITSAKWLFLARCFPSCSLDNLPSVTCHQA